MLIALTGIGAPCYAQPRTGDGAVKDITPHELSIMQGKDAPFVVDVNEDFTYAEAHVPGAVRMEYDAITLAALPPDRLRPVVFYCWSNECPAAGAAAETAIGLGFAVVYCMRAGITGWQDAGLATEP